MRIAEVLINSKKQALLWPVVVLVRVVLYKRSFKGYMYCNKFSLRLACKTFNFMLCLFTMVTTAYYMHNDVLIIASYALFFIVEVYPGILLSYPRWKQFEYHKS